MKFKLHAFRAMALIGLFLGGFTAAVAATPAPLSAAKFVPGEVLVKFKAGVSRAAGVATVAALGGTVQTNLGSGLVRVSTNPGQTVSAALASYGSDPNVDFVQPNFIYHATAATPSTATQYGQQWGLKNTGQTMAPPAAYLQGGGWVYTTNNPGTAGDDIHVEPAWGVITDCSSTVVAVVDTGVNYNQQDLAANMWSSPTYTLHGYNYTGEGAANDPMDLAGHGTHVAGIIGAAGGTTAGVCWKAKIMAVRVLDSTGSGTTASVIQGVNFAVTNGAKVINMSLGCEGCAFDQAYSNAITAAQTADVVVVVAAGNAGNDNDALPDYPCNFTQPNLICVAALDQGFNLASFSDWGATSVDVGAPGTNILSTWAGTAGSIAETFAAGWTTSKSNAASGGWTPITLTNGVTSFPGYADPAAWGTGLYAANTDDRAYKTFNLSGYNAAVLQVAASVNVTTDGSIALAASSAGGDPFAPATPTYLWGPGATDTAPTAPGTHYYTASGNLTSTCLTATCTIGTRLLTGATQDYGVVWYNFAINTLTLNTTSYNTENGTSMATPMVAGLATMLRAYNPSFTYADVVAAIKNAGRATPSLSGKTTTGKAIDATASLAYINQPTGLAATVK